MTRSGKVRAATFTRGARKLQFIFGISTKKIAILGAQIRNTKLDSFDTLITHVVSIVKANNQETIVTNQEVNGFHFLFSLIDELVIAHFEIRARLFITYFTSANLNLFFTNPNRESIVTVFVACVKLFFYDSKKRWPRVSPRPSINLDAHLSLGGKILTRSARKAQPRIEIDSRNHERQRIFARLTSVEGHGRRSNLKALRKRQLHTPTVKVRTPDSNPTALSRTTALASLARQNRRIKRGESNGNERGGGGGGGHGSFSFFLPLWASHLVSCSRFRLSCKLFLN